MEEAALSNRGADTLATTLDRMEAALERIEAAAASRPPPPLPESDTDLEQRHAALRSAVQSALSRLDTLIDAQA